MFGTRQKTSSNPRQNCIDDYHVSLAKTFRRLGKQDSTKEHTTGKFRLNIVHSGDFAIGHSYQVLHNPSNEQPAQPLYVGSRHELEAVINARRKRKKYRLGR